MSDNKPHFPIPPLPNFPSPSSEVRAKMLGKFRYQILSGGDIKILDGWAQKNIVKIHIPQLAGVDNAPESGIISFHRAGASQLQLMFEAWERAGLLHFIKTWAGSFAPRMIRGSKTALSNHAFGSAFDINAAWNPLGHPPATGEGTVMPLVRIANEHGFFWGGHYQNRKDGMHFELAVLNMFPKTAAVNTIALDDSEILDSAAEHGGTSSGNPSATSDEDNQTNSATDSAQLQPPIPAAPAQLETKVDSTGNSSVQSNRSVPAGFSPEKFQAYIPQIETAKKYFNRLTALTGISAVGAFLTGLPEWLVIALFVLLALIVIGGIVMFIKYHDKIFAYVTAMNTLRATDGAHDPILTTEAKKE